MMTINFIKVPYEPDPMSMIDIEVSKSARSIYIQKRFTFDGSHNFLGWTMGFVSNGFEAPQFDFEHATRVLFALTKANVVLRWAFEYPLDMFKISIDGVEYNAPGHLEPVYAHPHLTLYNVAPNIPWKYTGG